MLSGVIFLFFYFVNYISRKRKKALWWRFSDKPDSITYLALVGTNQGELLNKSKFRNIIYANLLTDI